MVAYDGSHYSGFQRQRGRDTIQARLEQALGRIGGQGRILAAGRTDAGVHARGQVVAFDLEWRHGPERLLAALNANLPPAIAFRTMGAVGAAFHPRFDALSRLYQYDIYCQAVRDPLRERFCWRAPRPLAVEAMNEAAAYLLGWHDFAAFGRPPQGANTRRRVLRAEWQAEGQRRRFLIEADAFLTRMVRSLVGTLALVGAGRMTAAEFAAVLAGADRSRAGATAPPHGLTLLRVAYPPGLGPPLA